MKCSVDNMNMNISLLKKGKCLFLMFSKQNIELQLSWGPVANAYIQINPT